MKKLKIFTEDMLAKGEIGEWRYKFRKFALPLLIALVLAIGSCVYVGAKYIEVRKDTDRIVNCISQASGEMSGDLEALVGKYHMFPNKRMSDSTVYEIICECGAWYPEVIMAQYKIESGGGKSALAKSANNLFGMRIAMRRPTTQLSGTSNSGYGVYLNWEHSIIDRVLWERWIFKNEKPDYISYMNRLESIYAESPSYRSAIESAAQKYRVKRTNP